MNYIRELRKKVGSGLLQVPGVAGVILNEERQLLLVRKSEDGTWSLPAGAIEPGETPGEAVVREVAEETGLIVRAAKVLGLFGGKEFRFTYPNGDQVEYLVSLFRCIPAAGSVTDTDGEVCEVAYFAESDMPPLALPYPGHLFFREQGDSAFN